MGKVGSISMVCSNLLYLVQTLLEFKHCINKLSWSALAKLVSVVHTGNGIQFVNLVYIGKCSNFASFMFSVVIFNKDNLLYRGNNIFVFHPSQLGPHSYIHQLHHMVYQVTETLRESYIIFSISTKLAKCNSIVKCSI